MARIRSIKPEFWDDEHLASLPIACRLFYIGCWTFADDQGVFSANPSFLKSRIFPYDDDLKVEDVRSWLKALENKKMIIPFSHERDSYYIVRKFAEHQVIDKRYFKRVVPEEVTNAVLGVSTECSGVHQETTASPPRGHSETSTPDRIRIGYINNNILNAHAHVCEEEKQVFYEYLFFKNVINPMSETERFITHNEAKQWTGKTGKVWSTTEQRMSLVARWKPNEPGERCSREFLSMWKKLYDSIKMSAPEVASAMLDEGSDGKWNGSGNPIIFCKTVVSNFIRINGEFLDAVIGEWSRGKKVSFQLPYD